MIAMVLYYRDLRSAVRVNISKDANVTILSLCTSMLKAGQILERIYQINMCIDQFSPRNQSDR